MKLSQAKLRRLLLLSLVSLLTSCGRSSSVPPDLESYVQELEDTYLTGIKAEKIEALAPESVAYEAHTLRSPFTAHATLQVKRKPSPLEKFPLKQLDLVGVMQYGKSTWAIFKAPNGKAYNVGIGSYIGQSDGRIVEITKTQVEITEQVANEFGKVVSRTVQLRLGSKGKDAKKS